MTDSSHSDKKIQLYTGTYYSPELECQFGIVLKAHQLFLTSNKYEDSLLRLIGNDQIINEDGVLSHLKIIRDTHKIIKGFEVNSGPIMHLRFNKIR